jgi:hypothetical protein
VYVLDFSLDLFFRFFEQRRKCGGGGAGDENIFADNANAQCRLAPILVL